MFKVLYLLFSLENLLFSVHGSLGPFLLKFMSLLNANAVLGGWRLGVGGVKANGLTGVGGGSAMVYWGSSLWWWWFWDRAGWSVDC